MLDWYATEFRFGDVVSLVSDLVRGGRSPNLNTYRIIINACQRASQPQLALEVYAVMRAKKIPILQEVRKKKEKRREEEMKSQVKDEEENDRGAGASICIAYAQHRVCECQIASQALCLSIYGN